MPARYSGNVDFHLVADGQVATCGNPDAVLGNVEKRLNSASEAPRVSAPFDSDFLTRCLPTRTTPAPLHGLEQ